jgi:hypothetical protein
MQGIPSRSHGTEFAGSESGSRSDSIAFVFVAENMVVIRPWENMEILSKLPSGAAPKKAHFMFL